MRNSSLINALSITLVAIMFSFCDQQTTKPEVQPLKSPTSSLLQAISIVDETTAWISGHNATIVTTQDGGQSWQVFNHPTGDSLQFRDIHAFDSQKAILMSAGEGPLSRIFSFNAPDQWQENFVMTDSLGFLDCIDFWDSENGIAYGDAIDRYPYILLTNDGGQSWSRADTTYMPEAGEGEGGFAASGTCVTTGDDGKAWIATGAGGNCRFLMTEDYGKSWKVVTSPLVKGEAAGNTSVSFIDSLGIVAGGDLMKPSDYTQNTAFSSNGGKAWNLGQQPNLTGAFYGSAITAIDDQAIAFVCGPAGIEYTTDFGNSWTTLDTLNYWAIGMKGKIGYASGTEGKILKISLQP